MNDISKLFTSYVTTGVHPYHNPLNSLLNDFSARLSASPESMNYFLSLKDEDKKKIVDYIRACQSGVDIEKNIKANIDNVVNNLEKHKTDFLKS
ncbi:MAG: hypothetical protein RR549_04580 [Oscillospiraceae bacterium]